jgi:rsbT co-antagonist protein RsbR
VAGDYSTDVKSVDVKSVEYADVTQLVNAMSKDRARQGYSPTETAIAVFSLKDALLGVLEEACADRPELLVTEIKSMNALVDDLGLQTFEAYVAGREEVIVSQQQSMLALSTPVVKLWDGIVALPLIGTLDSERTQTVMENLLVAIVDTESQVAIVDITGVVTVDTSVAQNLLKTVAATRLMGADCIISGIRPQIAQTMVFLGVELGDVVTKATLADAFRVALRMVGANLATASPRP